MRSSFRWTLMVTVLALRLAGQPLTPPALTVLHSIVPETSSPDLHPFQGLIQASDGLIYGANHYNGGSGGTIFRMATSGTAYSVVHSLGIAEGAEVVVLLQGRDGRLYGAARAGGRNSEGTLFALNLDGTGFTVLHDFFSAVTDGGQPSGLVEGADGRLYGTNSSGGTNASGGTIYRVNRDGTGSTVLWNFSFLSDGADPLSGLTQGSDGGFYGSTLFGGAKDRGTLFRINADGTGFSVLRHMGPSDGYAWGRLLSSGGKLYGMTVDGGTQGFGSIYRMNLDGTGFTVLRSFDSAGGSAPRSGLIQARDGMFYGVAPEGGLVDNSGTLFRFNPSNAAYDVLWSPRLQIEGSVNWSELMQGADLKLYGATQIGGASNGGTIFAFSLLPQLASAAFLNAKVGEALTYHLVATNSPVSFSANGVPAGLGFDSTSGLLSGTPVKAGSFGITVGATNLDGTTTATLTLNVDKGAATVGLSNLSQTFNGRPASVTVTTTPAGLPLAISYNGSATPPSGAGTYSVVATVNDSNYAGSATGTLTIAKASGLISLSNLSQAFDGSPKSVAVTTVPAGLPVTTTYNGSATAPSATGVYNVVATITDPNYAGNATATLTVVLQPPAITGQTASQTVVAGTSTILSATVTGSPLFTYQWQRKPNGAATFNALADGTEFSGATTPQLTVLSPAFAMNGDQFRLVATNALGSVTGESIVLGVVPTSRLHNLSVRANVVAGQPLTVGFVTSTGAPPILLRAIGPGLAPFVPASLTLAGDPSLAVFDSTGGQLTANDNWANTTEMVGVFSTVGAFPLPANSQDAALVFPMNGARTAQMDATKTGLGLVEIYDTTDDNAVRLINLSVLYGVGAGTDGLVAGFVVTGTGTKTLLVRGIGPGLRTFGVSDALVDPRLDVFDGTGKVILGADDWSPSLAAAFAQVGAFALTPGSKDSALIFIARPGVYSVQLSSVDGTVGKGLLEIYELPQ